MAWGDTPLTGPQQTFAEANHGMLLKFISSNHLDDEFYSVLVERYLKLVVQYLESEDLQRYSFSTVMWNGLRSELASYWRKLQQEPVMEPDPDELSCEMEPPVDPSIWTRIEEVLTKKQVETVMLRDQGFSNREIGEICRVSEKAIEKRFCRIRKRLNKGV